MVVGHLNLALTQQVNVVENALRVLLQSVACRS
jgi:hypothetical protein